MKRRYPYELHHPLIVDENLTNFHRVFFSAFKSWHCLQMQQAPMANSTEQRSIFQHVMPVKRVSRPSEKKVVAIKFPDPNFTSTGFQKKGIASSLQHDNSSPGWLQSLRELLPPSCHRPFSSAGVYAHVLHPGRLLASS